MHMAAHARPWTLEDLDRLPDDGNKYELLRGELAVTPPPNTGHETIGARLNALLVPFVARNELGLVYLPHSVIEDGESRAEPDLSVRRAILGDIAWQAAPVPLL